MVQVSSTWPQALTDVKSIEVGLSGGLDSVVLLHILWRLQQQKQFRLSAVHVHHGLNPQADAWAEFCASLCACLNIGFRLEQVRFSTARLGLEAAARQARYEIYAKSSAPVLALGHHADDQVETFYLATLRGGGTRALASMPIMRPLNESIVLWRPLLTISRQQIQQYAQNWELNYVDDCSNADTALLRNWLRLSGLPPWRQQLPQLNQHICSSIAVLQDECAILDEVRALDWQHIYQNGRFNTAQWRALSSPRRRQLLAWLAIKQDLGSPSAHSIRDFERMLVAAASEQIEWTLPFGKVYANQQWLFAVRNGWEKKLKWGSVPQFGFNNLYDNLVNTGFTLCRHAFGICEDVLAKKGAVRIVQTDDALLLTVGHKKVRKILQERRIPSFVRKYWPVVVDSQNQCIAIANIWVSRHYGCLNGFLPVFDEFNAYIMEPK